MTKEWAVQENLLPFVCDECQKELTNDEIFHLINSIGNVHLTNGEFTFVGLNCPHCKNTTIKKYQSFSIIEDLKSLIDPSYFFLSFVTFIHDHSLVLSEINQEDLFKVPQNIPYIKKITKYPKWYIDQCLFEFSEKDIGAIVNWENQYKKFAFPRVIGPSSIHHKTDKILLDIKGTKNEMFDDIHELSIIYDKLYELIAWIARDSYLSNEQTTITKSEYKDLKIRFNWDPGDGPEFADLFKELSNEFLEKRNDFNFPQTWKSEFLDKYIRKIYYHKGYYKSKQYYNDKWCYEDMYGKVFKGSFKGVHSRLVANQLFFENMSGLLPP